jgi:Flp pilus assembly protein TadG
MKQKQEGQALVELALFVPVMLTFALFCLQVALIFFAYLSVLNASRDVGRWLAVHPHTVDATTIATIRSRLPSGLDSADLAITISPTCTALVTGKCPNRPVGARLAVTMTYDVADHVILPVFPIELPTTLPAYTLHMAVEPS